MDLVGDRLSELRAHPRFRFFQGDMTVEHDWVGRRIEECDVVLPLVAIATPATYLTDPLRVFELDFAANLTVIRAVAAAGHRLVFPFLPVVSGHDGEG